MLIQHVANLEALIGRGFTDGGDLALANRDYLLQGLRGDLGECRIYIISRLRLGLAPRAETMTAPMQIDIPSFLGQPFDAGLA